MSMKRFYTAKFNMQNIFPNILKGVTFLSAGITLSACLSAAPLIIETFAKAFGANLLSTAVHNYSPQYGNDLEDLLYAMGGTLTKDGSRQQANSQSFAEDQFQEFQNYEEQASFVDASQTINEPQQFNTLSQGSEYDPNYSDQQGQVTDYQSSYANQQWQEAEIAMSVDILAQRVGDSSNSTPAPIQDGESLYSHPTDPGQGDKIKVSFNANCDCYVYVVGIDSTGYVVQIFPDSEAGLTNPVQNNNGYLVPGGDDWYGLDEYTGTEEIYFIASKNRRLDLERIIQKLSTQERNIDSNYLAVQQAPVIPNVRGLVKISSLKTAFVQSTSGESHAFTPTLFISTAENADLVITRWFIHQ